MLKELYKDKKEIENFPAALREFLDNPETLKKINDIIDFFKLGAGEQQKLKEIILKLAGGEINLYDAGPAISDELEMEFSEALDINDKLYEELFAPIEGDLNAAYAARQMAAPAEILVVSERDMEKSQEKKSEFLPLIDKAIKKFNLFFVPSAVISVSSSVIPAPYQSTGQAPAGIQAKEDEALKNRFYEIADSFLSGARTKAQFKNSLTKDAASGGLGWEKEKAGEVAEFFSSYMRINEIEKKEKTVKSPPTPLLQRGEKELLPPLACPAKPMWRSGEKEGGLPADFSGATPVPSPAYGGATGQAPPNGFSAVREAGGGFIKSDRTDFQSEEKEAERMKEKMKGFKTAAPAEDIGKKINGAVQELNLDFPSSELNERLKSVIDARLRNVRTSVQTQEKLVLDVASGGLGLPKTEANRVSLVLNKYLDAANKDLYQDKMSEKQEFEKQELAGKEEREREEKEKEMQNLNARFKKLTGKEAPSPAATAPVFSPMTPSKPKSIPISPEKIPLNPPFIKEETPPPLKKEGRLPVVSSGATKPNGFSAVREAGGEFSASPPATIRPVVEDIKFTPKLYGPLEEIGQMTLDDFRKLSGDPNEVMLKIKDKLGLLRGESFKKYQAGIEAWHKSLVYAEYLKILEQSLKTGLPLAESIVKNKTLTQLEFDAIINSRVEE